MLFLDNNILTDDSVYTNTLVYETFEIWAAFKNDYKSIYMKFNDCFGIIALHFD